MEGTTNGLITDVDGHFSIQASVGQNLVISYIGYETQVVKIVRAKPANQYCIERKLGVDR